MRQICAFSLLLASLLLATNALAQTDNHSDLDTLPQIDSVTAARAQYAQTANHSRNDGDGEMLAQFRGGRRPPFPSRREYSRGLGYQAPWMDHGNARHALIGAAIGFGIGAGLGAAGSQDHSQVGGRVVLGGTIFGLIGAAIGSAHGGGYPFARRRRIFPAPSSEDEEAKAAQLSATSSAGNESHVEAEKCLSME
jgi:hypothetical protein